MARVLVVGGAGLLGQYLLREARERGHDAVGTHRGPLPASGGWRSLDLLDPGRIAGFVQDVRPELVVNAAALTDVDGCEGRPEEARAVNALAAGLLAKAAVSAGAGFVHASTDYVFDGTGPADETTTPNPLSVYGKTKLEGERLVLEAHPDAVVLRLSAVFGWNRRTVKPNAVTWVLQKLEEGQEVRLFRDQRVTPTYAREAAAAAFDLWERGASGVFHVASKDCLSRFEAGQVIADVFGFKEANLVPVPMSSVALAARRPPAACLIVRKVEETLKRDMPGFRECLEDMRAER